MTGSSTRNAWSRRPIARSGNLAERGKVVGFQVKVAGGGIGKFEVSSLDALAT